MKIFGIGLSRTGTTSLWKALQMLGFRVLHYPPLYELPRLLRQYDGAIDTPVACCYRELDQVYPGSRYILTVRDKASWLAASERFFQKRPAFLLDDWQVEVRLRIYGAADWDLAAFSEAYDKHLAQVNEYFSCRVGDYLVLNIIDGEGWEKLCPFLDSRIPIDRFPRLNVASA